MFRLDTISLYKFASKEERKIRFIFQTKYHNEQLNLNIWNILSTFYARVFE